MIEKKIPTLAELLGDGTRGDGWEELERATRQYLSYSKEGEGATMTLFLRLFCVAAVEGARQSTSAYPDTVSAMCKAAGIAVATAAGSACDDDKIDRLAELKPILSGLVADGINFIIDYKGKTMSGTDPITDYWLEHYVVDGLCSLCGNSGQVDTTGARSPVGAEVGRKQPCICPNGQALRRSKSERKRT